LEWWKDPNHPGFNSDVARDERETDLMLKALEHLQAEKDAAEIAKAVAEATNATKH
jgi:hypothetical protein